MKEESLVPKNQLIKGYKKLLEKLKQNLNKIIRINKIREDKQNHSTNQEKILKKIKRNKINQQNIKDELNFL